MDRSAGRAGFSFPREGGVPEPWRLPAPIEQREYLADGEIRRWRGPAREVLSPLCLRGGGGPRPPRLGSYPLLTESESLAALEAAARAHDGGRGAWATMPVEERIRHAAGFAARMRAARGEVVRLLMWEVGKSLADSEAEFDRTVAYIENTIDALKDLDRRSSRFVIEEGVIGQIRRAPLGLALCMGPYNYPLNETYTTLLPALIMGNSVLVKPPKLGVLLHRPLLEALRDSFPPGVVQTLYGDGAQVVGPLMESGRLDLLAFIGSSRVADILRRQHPRPHRLRCVLGLEAKNPAIVLPDADLDLTARECLLGTLSFNGQRCTALKILFVHRRLLQAFLERFRAGLAGLHRGMPWEPEVALTPLADPGRIEYLARLVADAAAHGATIVNAGGGEVGGTFMEPAVLSPVTPAMRVYHEEQFGPLVPIVPFDELSEPLAYVAASPYGQQISLFGRDPRALAELIDPLVNQLCRVNLNSQCQRGPDSFPFTGRKDSAEGTLSVADALRVFSIRTLVAAKETEENRRIVSAIVRERHSRFLSTDFIF